jgi:RarD protein
MSHRGENMTNKANNLSRLIISMCIFGTIGILRKFLPLSSTLIALCRAAIGSVFLICVVLLRKEKLIWCKIKKNLLWLSLSGAAIGFNWIFLFEAYNYTTVTTATLCYYMAPTIAVVASHFLFKEHLTVKKGVCVLVAFLGMVLVSGAAGGEIPTVSELKGVIFGLAAAVLYGSVILLNKKIAVGSPYVKTLFQLAVAGLVLFPYTALTENLFSVTFSPSVVLLLAVAGIVHTGFAYALYFGSIKELKTQTVALLSYIDPILAIVLSALILHEPMGIKEIIGSVLILGAAYISEK